MAMNQRKVEVFIAGCKVCDQTVALVQQLACGSCEVTVHDMHRPEVATTAERYGIHRLPAVVVDGKLAECCVDSGLQESALRAAGIGQQL